MNPFGGLKSSKINKKKSDLLRENSNIAKNDGISKLIEKTTELSSAESEPVAQLKQLLKDPNFPLTSNGQFVLSQLDGLTAPGIVNDLS